MQAEVDARIVVPNVHFAVLTAVLVGTVADGFPPNLHAVAGVAADEVFTGRRHSWPKWWTVGRSILDIIAPIDLTVFAFVIRSTAAERILTGYAEASIPAQFFTTEIFAAISGGSLRATTFRKALFYCASTSVVAIVITAVDLATSAIESILTLALILIGGRFPTDATIFASEVRALFTLWAAIALRTATRQTSIVRY